MQQFIYRGWNITVKTIQDRKTGLWVPSWEIYKSEENRELSISKLSQPPLVKEITYATEAEAQMAGKKAAMKMLDASLNGS